MTSDNQSDKTTTEGGDQDEKVEAPPAAAPPFDVMELATAMAAAVAPLLQQQQQTAPAAQVAPVAATPPLLQQGAQGVSSSERRLTREERSADRADRMFSLGTWAPVPDDYMGPFVMEKRDKTHGGKHYIVPTEMLKNIDKAQTLEYDNYQWVVLPQLIVSRKVMRQIGIITAPNSRSGTFNSEFGPNKGHECTFVKDAEDVTSEETPVCAQLEIQMWRDDINYLERSGDIHSVEGQERFERASARIAELSDGDGVEDDLYSDEDREE